MDGKMLWVKDCIRYALFEAIEAFCVIYFCRYFGLCHTLFHHIYNDVSLQIMTRNGYARYVSKCVRMQSDSILSTCQPAWHTSQTGEGMPLNHDCRYSDHRTPPWVENQYKRTAQYWEILVWKFAFVVIFENTIAALMTLIRWIIPDVPKSIREKIRQDNKLTNEIIILQELRRRHIEPNPPA